MNIYYFKGKSKVSFKNKVNLLYKITYLFLYTTTKY